jgi:uncharacterized coiled-coil protein SlyX
MSDDLVKRLREGATWDDDIAAADRIEALEAQLAERDRALIEWADVSQRNYQRAKALQAQLAESMNHVMDYSNDPHLVDFARTILAKIGGIRVDNDQ